MIYSCSRTGRFSGPKQGDLYAQPLIPILNLNRFSVTNAGGFNLISLSWTAEIYKVRTKKLWKKKKMKMVITVLTE